MPTIKTPKLQKVTKKTKRARFRKWMHKIGYKTLRIKGNRAERRKKVHEELLEAKKERRIRVDPDTAAMKRKQANDSRRNQARKNKIQQRAAKVRREKRARAK